MIDYFVDNDYICCSLTYRNIVVAVTVLLSFCCQQYPLLPSLIVVSLRGDQLNVIFLCKSLVL